MNWQTRPDVLMRAECTIRIANFPSPLPFFDFER
jgi:hypothetical protein